MAGSDALTRAARGMIASPHRLASEAGLGTLREGGSAVDAAIAAAAVLCVVYPHMTSVGGDAFWLVHEARRGGVRYLNGGGRAAAAGTLDWFASRGLAEIPLRGIVPATLTVPGAVDSWCEAHAALGRLSLARDLAPAVAHAREGFEVSGRVARWTAESAELLGGDPGAAAIFLPGGRAPRPGQRLVNADLARTLEGIGAQGRSGFYDGEVAREMARHARAHGGFFTEGDFRSQRACWGEALSTTYRGVTIHETPPPTQGLAVLEMLNLLEPYDVGAMAYLGPEHVHLLVQAKMLAYRDRDRLLADPDFAKVPVDWLLSRAHADERRRHIDMGRALPWDGVPAPGGLAGDTVYVCAVDGEGNAASLIQSVYGIYGSGVMAGRTGVVLQNRSAYFSLDPAHPNRLEPGKIPFHTLIASLAFRDGRLWQAFGCMGADGQPQIHLQAYTAMIDFGRSLGEALAAPRWLSGRFVLGDPRDLLNMEGRFPEETFAELARRGHHINRWGAWSELAGHAHGITIDPDTAERLGAADPRSDGAALGH